MKKEQPNAEQLPSNGQMMNYNEYHFFKGEYLLYLMIFFVCGGAVGFIFYGNLFMEDGEPTLLSHISNVIVFASVGILAIRIFLPRRRKQLIVKQKSTLRLQFREMLAALSTAYLSGENTMSAFASAQKDMIAQFGDTSFIAVELTEIVTGIYNGGQIDELLLDFGQRSGVEDINDFANIFQICQSKGGNMKEVVRNSYDLIGEKLSINDEIQTKITSNQMQQNIMSVVPIVMIAFLRFSSSAFAASFATLKGVIAMTVAAGIFIGSYLYGEKITDIKG